MFPAREANFQQLTYRSLERSPDSPGNSGCRIQCPGVSFARPLQRKYFRPFLDSFLFCLFTIGVRISWKSGVGKRAMAAENLFHVMPPTFRLVYFIEWRVTLSKLLWNFEWTLTTRIPNCRVRIIDFFTVLPTNFRIASLPPADTNLTGIDVWYTHRAWVTCALFKQHQFNYCIRNRGNELEARTCDSCGLGSRSIGSTHTESRKYSFSFNFLISTLSKTDTFGTGTKCPS